MFTPILSDLNSFQPLTRRQESLQLGPWCAIVCSEAWMLLSAMIIGFNLFLKRFLQYLKFQFHSHFIRILVIAILHKPFAKFMEHFIPAFGRLVTSMHHQPELDSSGIVAFEIIKLSHCFTSFQFLVRRKPLLQPGHNAFLLSEGREQE